MPRQTDIQLASDLRTVVARLVKKLRKKSETSRSLSLTERSTMALLDQHGELLPNELATMEQITNQSMSQVLNHLDELSYIFRRTSKEDKRKVIVTLSAKGKAVLQQMRSERATWLYQALIQCCSSAEIDVLKKTIEVLQRLVDYEGV